MHITLYAHTYAPERLLMHAYITTTNKAFEQECNIMMLRTFFANPCLIPLQTDFRTLDQTMMTCDIILSMLHYLVQIMYSTDRHSGNINRDVHIRSSNRDMYHECISFIFIRA